MIIKCLVGSSLFHEVFWHPAKIQKIHQDKMKAEDKEKEQRGMNMTRNEGETEVCLSKTYTLANGV